MTHRPIILGLLALYFVGWLVTCIDIARGPLASADGLKLATWAVGYAVELAVFGWWAWEFRRGRGN